MRRVIMTAVLSCAIVGASSAEAQGSRTPISGDRVWITAQDDSGKIGSLQGVLLDVTDTTLVIAGARGAPSTVLLRDIRKLEIGTGRREYGRSAGVGALNGTSIGVLIIIALVEYDLDCEFWCFSLPDPRILIGLPAAGALIGAVVGFVTAPEKYVTADVPATKVGLARMPDGRVGLTLSRSF